VRSSQYGEAINKIATISLQDLNDRQVKELFDTASSAALSLQETEEQIRAYDLIIDLGSTLQVRGKINSSLREQMAKAFFNKGFRLGKLNRNEEAIQSYDEVIKRFGEASEPAIRQQMARAFFNKGVRLGELNRNEEAIQAYDELIKRFGEATEPVIRKIVAHALNGIGFTMICDAKRIWKEGNDRLAQEILLTSLEKIKSALEITPDEPIILGNLGYIYFLQGNIEQARELLTKAITLGGEESRQAELADADIHSLPQDEEFRALIHSIPVAAPEQ
jgi:tetratricopeptide (TPR) repeat protein